MLFKTHLLFGIVASLVAVRLGVAQPTWVFFALVIVSSLVPDLDTPGSYLGQRAWPISGVFRFLMGHRTILHSIWFPFILYLGLLGWSPEVSLGILLGYCSHLLLDLLNEQGIRPFYPINFRVSGPFRTGGFGEIVVFVFFLVLAGWLILGFWM
jgi:inner membrane protein